MNPHKLYLPIVLALILILAVCGVAWLRAHDAWLRYEAHQQARDEKVQQDKQTFQSQQKIVDTATSSSKQVQSDTDRRVAELQEQLNSKPNSEDIKKIIQSAIPTVTVTQDKGQISIPDTPENREAILKKDIEFKTCGLQLDGCNKINYNQQSTITAKDGQIFSLQDVVKQRDNQISELNKQKKGGFWHKVGECAARGAVGGASGGLSGDPRRAGAGAALGLGSCLVWKP